MTKTSPAQPRERLEALGTVLAEIASGIRCAQEALIESEQSAGTAYLVAQALGRLGWMADQGCVLAGTAFPPVVGDAYAWLLIPPALASLRGRTAGK